MGSEERDSNKDEWYEHSHTCFSCRENNRSFPYLYCSPWWLYLSFLMLLLLVLHLDRVLWSQGECESVHVPPTPLPPKAVCLNWSSHPIHWCFGKAVGPSESFYSFSILFWLPIPCLNTSSCMRLTTFKESLFFLLKTNLLFTCSECSHVLLPSNSVPKSSRAMRKSSFARDKLYSPYIN